MKNQTNDYGMLFENIVKAVFGRPKTPIYFAGYHDISNDESKYILFTLCIYILNYKEVSQEEQTQLEDFLADQNYLNEDHYYKMLDYLGKKYSIS